MNTTQIEFPAYNIFFRQDGMWMLYGSPLVQKTYKEVQGIAHDLLFSSNNTDAVRIYGIFQCQMNFIREIRKKDVQESESDENRMRRAVELVIQICDEEVKRGSNVLTDNTFDVIRKLLSKALVSQKGIDDV